MRLSDYMVPFYIACMVVSVFVSNAYGQADSVEGKYNSGRERDVFSVGIGVQHGFIFAHSQAVQNTKGSNPTGVEGILSWQRIDTTMWELCNCYPRRGLLLSYYDYDNKVLGKSYTAAYFLEPTYRIGKGTFFSFRGAAGGSYLTNPYDPTKNPTNLSYSTTLSGYLLLGIGFWQRLDQHWWLNASVNYQHESNGGLKEPNKGINWPTAGIALSYAPNARSYYRGARTKEKTWKNQPVRWDIGLFGIARRLPDENGDSRRLALIGLDVQGGKQVGRINMLTVSTEVYWDEKLRMRLKEDSIDAIALKAGIMAGHEFLLGKFVFSQRLGVYVLDQSPYYDQFYHRWGLTYRLDKQWGVGFNLKAHRHVADFIDLRVVYKVSGE